MKIFILAVFLNIVGALATPDYSLREFVQKLQKHRKVNDDIEFHDLIMDPSVLTTQPLELADYKKSNPLFNYLTDLGFTYNENQPRNDISTPEISLKGIQQLKSIQHQNSRRGSGEPFIIIITKKSGAVITPSNKRQMNIKMNIAEKFDGDNNDASEIDESTDLNKHDFRRRSKDIGSSSSSDTDSSDQTASSSSESSLETNPGNPFTIHKNKYKQNWLWNHFMDGDHMNVNPHAPLFQGSGPSGAQLFFGRKWWYFNQDDYKPMG